MKRHFLFDLDGTVTDTGEGIMKSAQYALDDFGFPDQPKEALRRFIGPPLDHSFRDFYGLSEQDAWTAVKKFRERYREQGVFESPLYPGMKELLERLAAKPGVTVCLATSKPMHFAGQILEMRGVKPYFSVLVGANLDGSMTDKAQVITEVLRQLGDPPKAEVLMVGDRKHDILGAAAVGVESVGAGYGYAEEGELEDAGATYLVPTVAELEQLLFRLAE